MPADDFRSSQAHPRPAVIYDVAIVSVRRVPIASLRHARLPRGVDAGHVWRLTYAWASRAAAAQRNPEVAYGLAPIDTSGQVGTRLADARGNLGCSATTTRLAKRGVVYGGCVLMATTTRHGLAYVRLVMPNALQQSVARWKVG